MTIEQLLTDFDRLEFEFAKRLGEEANRKYGCDFTVMRTSIKGNYSAVSQRYTTRGTPKELWRALEVYGSGFRHGRSDDLKASERYAALTERLQQGVMTDSEMREVLGIPKAGQ